MLNYYLDGFAFTVQDKDRNWYEVPLENVTFTGRYAKEFEKIKRRVINAREVCSNMFSNMKRKDSYIEMVVTKIDFRGEYYIIDLEDSDMGKYRISISDKGFVHCMSNIEDILYNLLENRKPTFSDEKTFSIRISKNYLDLVPISVILDDDKYIQIEKYSKTRVIAEDIRFGAEFEINSRTAKEDNVFNKVLKYLIDKHNLIIQYDSSVAYCEIKTQALPYDQFYTVISDFTKLRNMFKNYFKSDKAGFHIHITCQNDTTRNKASDLRYEIYTIMDDQLFEKFFGRKPNSYCKIGISTSDRHTFINLESVNTIEIRGGTTKITCDMKKLARFAKMFSDIIHSEESVHDNPLLNEMIEYIMNNGLVPV